MSSPGNLPGDLWEPDGSLSQFGIKQAIPYDEPFLFVSRVLSLEETYVEAEYRIDPDAWFLRGHFVGWPVMPGSLIAEGLGQVGTILVRSRIAEQEKKHVFAYRVKDMRFRNMALPGETLLYRVRLLSLNTALASLEGDVSVARVVVAQGRLVQAIVDKEDLHREVPATLASCSSQSGAQGFEGQVRPPPKA